MQFRGKQRTILVTTDLAEAQATRDVMVDVRARKPVIFDSEYQGGALRISSTIAYSWFDSQGLDIFV